MGSTVTSPRPATTQTTTESRTSATVIPSGPKRAKSHRRDSRIWVEGMRYSAES